MPQPLCRPSKVSSPPQFCSFLEYVCSNFVSFKVVGNGESRPLVDGTFYGVKASCLVDMGTSILVIAHSIFELITNSSSLPSFPVSPSWRLSAMTGNELELVGRYEFKVRILGRTFFRPFFVVKGMAKTEVILGYDFIREAKLAISCDHMFFSSALNHKDNF